MRAGTRESFPYLECADCGCIQAAAIAPEAALAQVPDDRALAAPPGGVAWTVRDLRRWILGVGAGPGSAIADVGAGSAELLRGLRALGFRDLTGSDPMGGEAVAEPGLRLRGGALAGLEGAFDVVVVRNVLERMPDQLLALRDLARALGPRGVALVRTPVADSWARREYGADWVHLDAPRHLHVHTRRSLERVAANAGLRVASVRHDSGALQFWGSELYRRDLALVDPATSRPRDTGAHFGWHELPRFRLRARRLDAAGEGDQACFRLVRA
jgi:SAM-dependent methyltransferase